MMHPTYMMHPAAAAIYAAAIATAGLFMPPFNGGHHGKGFFDGSIIRPHPLLPHLPSHFGLPALPPALPPADIDDLPPATPMVDVVDSSSSSCSSDAYQRDAFRESVN